MEALKSAIIGKMWTNSDVTEMVPATYTVQSDTTFKANQSFLIGGLTFRTDRNLIPTLVKAGSKLFFYVNQKRDGKQDADYNVSALFSEAVANEIIANNRKGAEEWKQAHQVEMAA